nr:MAG TPA: hypothetical protein [Caudoviricetes sp.]
MIKKVLLRSQKRANGFEAPKKIWVQGFRNFSSVPERRCLW